MHRRLDDALAQIEGEFATTLFQEVLTASLAVGTRCTTLATPSVPVARKR